MNSVGFVGYSAQEFDKEKARSAIKSLLGGLSKRFPQGFEVVSVLTWLGIPGIVYEEATAKGFNTVGIACRKAFEYECYPVDEEVIVGSNWGDESETFLNRIDYLVRIGGGKQSLEETAMAKKMGKEVIEIDLG